MVSQGEPHTHTWNFPHGKTILAILLAVLSVGAYARRRRRRRKNGGYTPANKLTETCSFGLLRPSLILDIHVIVNWQLGEYQNKVSADQYDVNILRA